MLRQLNIAVRLLGVLTLLTGILYPAVVTGIARVAFAHQAGGSMIYEQDRAVGSELIGQEFTRPEYFWGRLSATGPVPYNAAASSGSNVGPLNPQLPAAAAARIEALRKYRAPAERIPVDLVTASASGLDPHISPAAAEFQVPRVATARHMSDEAVRNLVRQCTAGRQFGVLGEARVNVLELNLLLDRQHPSP